VHVAAQQQHVLPLEELAVAHVAVALDQPARRRHEKGPGEVRGGLREHVRGVGHDHPRLGGRRHVDVVVADGDIGHHPEPGGGREHLGVDGIGDEANEPASIPEPGRQLGLAQGSVAGVQIDVGAAARVRDDLVGEGPRDQNRCPVTTLRHYDLRI
jgi:hypothetical protein